jgi:hypothetical protein
MERARSEDGLLLTYELNTMRSSKLNPRALFVPFEIALAFNNGRPMRRQISLTCVTTHKEIRYTKTAARLVPSPNLVEIGVG